MALHEQGSDFSAKQSVSADRLSRVDDQSQSDSEIFTGSLVFEPSVDGTGKREPDIAAPRRMLPNGRLTLAQRRMIQRQRTQGNRAGIQPRRSTQPCPNAEERRTCGNTGATRTEFARRLTDGKTVRPLPTKEMPNKR
jgi:hypothetical protein